MASFTPIVAGTVIDGPGSVYTPPPLSQTINTALGSEFLQGEGWPAGLIKHFMQNLPLVPLRFFILDDSGSMLTGDGNRLVGKRGDRKEISCSRWSELTEMVKFHAAVASRSNAPTEFRFLNMGAPITVGVNDAGETRRMETLFRLLDDSPSGETPLCHHLSEVVQRIKVVEPQLRSSGKKACVVIATDGKPSDGDISDAIRELKNLPVLLVLRVCTNDRSVMDFWKVLDGYTESFRMDVLDDLASEAQEVNKCNPWLSYAEPLHHMREFGDNTRAMDVLDERLLSLDEFQSFCSCLFGDELKTPGVNEDWNAFIRKVDTASRNHPVVWNPIIKANERWINCSKFAKAHNKGGCVIS